MPSSNDFNWELVHACPGILSLVLDPKEAGLDPQNKGLHKAGCVACDRETDGRVEGLQGKRERDERRERRAQFALSHSSVVRSRMATLVGGGRAQCTHRFNFQIMCRPAEELDEVRRAELECYAAPCPCLPCWALWLMLCRGGDAS